MGKETKIGLAVVAVLVVFFGVVIARKLQRSNRDDGPIASDTTAPHEGLDATNPEEDIAPVVVGTGGSFDPPENSLAPLEDEYPYDETAGADQPIDDLGRDLRADPQFHADVNDGFQPAADDYDQRMRMPPSAAQASAVQLDELPDAGDLQEQFPDQADAARALTAVEEPADSQTWRRAEPELSTLEPQAPQSEALADDHIQSQTTANYQPADTGTTTFGGQQPETYGAASSSHRRTLTGAAALEQSRGIDPFDQQQWVVREGDSFWSISAQRYGSGRYFKALARWNEKTVPDPQQMRPGTVLDIPAASLLEQSDPTLTPKKRSTAGGLAHSSNEPAGAFLSSSGEKLYRVDRADTLYGISKKTLGQGSRWKELFELNQDVVKDPHRLAPGMILRLPASAAGSLRISSESPSGTFR